MGSESPSEGCRQWDRKDPIHGSMFCLYVFNSARSCGRLCQIGSKSNAVLVNVKMESPGLAGGWRKWESQWWSFECPALNNVNMWPNKNGRIHSSMHYCFQIDCQCENNIKRINLNHPPATHLLARGTFAVRSRVMVSEKCDWTEAGMPSHWRILPASQTMSSRSRPEPHLSAPPLCGRL